MTSIIRILIVFIYISSQKYITSWYTYSSHVRHNAQEWPLLQRWPVLQRIYLPVQPLPPLLQSAGSIVQTDLSPIYPSKNIYNINDKRASKVPKLRLIDGYEMPMIAIGTYTITDETVIKNVIEDGLEIGYRHIDTAYLYKNERFIGEKLREIFNRKSGPKRIRREDLFVTSKLWSTYHSRAKVVEGLRLTLKKLNIGYLDLFLIHFPFSLEEGGEDWPSHPNGYYRDSNISVVETWLGMEDAYRLGLVRSIGVSNFNVDQLSRIMHHGQYMPVVNQLEVNPYLSEECLVNFCHSNGIQVVAYSPLSKANVSLLNEPVLKEFAQKYKKTVAQVIMRWHIQRNLVVVPGTTKKSRQIENFQIFDFHLNDNEMNKISKLNKNFRKTTFSFAKYNKEYSYKNMCWY